MVSACGHRNVVPRFLFYQVLNTYYFHIGVVGRHCWQLEEAAMHHHDAADCCYPKLQAVVGCNCNHFDMLEGAGM